MKDRDKKKPPAEPPGPSGPSAETGPDDPPRRPLRRFTVAEAVGRAAGSSLKGASPVARPHQMLLELRTLLENRLEDPEGSLIRVLLARLQNDLPLLDAHREHPPAALARLLDAILADADTLARFVREVDARWGRDYDERPRFERSGAPPLPDDPYTVAEVRARLVRLRRELTG